MEFETYTKVIKGRVIYGLIAEMAMATRVLKMVKGYHLSVQHFDRAETLSAKCAAQRPMLVILDFDHLEAEAFKFLNEATQNADLIDMPVIGFVSQSKEALKSEAQNAGCHRVYGKTEFQKSLGDIIMRYAV